MGDRKSVPLENNFCAFFWQVVKNHLALYLDLWLIVGRKVPHILKASSNFLLTKTIVNCCYSKYGSFCTLLGHSYKIVSNMLPENSKTGSFFLTQDL